MTELQSIDAVEEARATDSTITKDGFVKTYKSEARSVVIEKDDKSSKLDMALASSYKVMVGAGASVRVAAIRVNDWDGKDDLFDALGFYNRKDSSKMSKSFTLKYAEDKTTTITETVPDGSGKEFSFDVVSPDWDNAVAFKKLSDLPHKDITIGIYTDTVLGEKVEWLPTVDGFDLYEWAAYDVAEIDSHEYDTTQGRYNSLVMIDATHFILAYTGADFDGFIKTFSIDASYDTIAEIDVLEHDTILGISNSLVMMDSTHFALAYKQSTYGAIRTFSIDGNYDNITTIDTLVDSVARYNNSLVKIDATHLILAYKGASNDGFIKTFSVDGDCDNITEIDELEHDTVGNSYNSLVMIDATHFILAYADYQNDGVIKTFSIDGSYDNIAQIHSLEHDTADSTWNSLVKIDATHFILAYSSTASNAWIKTFSINGSYVTVEIDALEHDTAITYGHSLIMIDSTHFVLAYISANNGHIKTFSIDGSYDTIAEIDELEHDTGTITKYEDSLVKIDANHCMLAYVGVGDDGFLKTFSIEAPVEAPTVTTQAVDTPVPGGATLNGNITDDGGASITQHGFCWKAGSDPVNIAGADGSSTLGAGAEGAFDQAKTGLTGNTLYYVRAYATNSDSTAYGAAVSFTTGSTTSIKTIMGVPIADIKTINGVAIADIKAFNGVSNVS